MFGDMMNKLQDMQKGMEETKARLENVFVDEDSNGIKITMNGNRKVKEITIDSDLLSDKEELEDLLIIAMNRVIEKATKVNETELGASAKGLMPNFPGL